MELMQELRRRHNTVLGIALTGMDAVEYKDSCREAGFSGYLMKPLDLNLLLREIATVSRGGANGGDGDRVDDSHR